MYEQFNALAAPPGNVTVQVLPLSAGTHDSIAWLAIRGGGIAMTLEWHKSARSAQGETQCVEITVWDTGVPAT